MSDSVICLPVRDRWLFSVDVLRKPDGTLAARLVDMRASDIRADEHPRHALLRLVADLREAADGMEQEALLIGDAPSGPETPMPRADELRAEQGRGPCPKCWPSRLKPWRDLPRCITRDRQRRAALLSALIARETSDAEHI